MEKFGVNFGGGPSRKELLDTIESQKKQMVQYQTRFKDVVRAYKSLLKEKEALEASLKVLSAAPENEAEAEPSLQSAELLEDGCSLHSEDSVDTAASVDSPHGSSRGEQSEEEQAEPGGRSSSAVPDAGLAEGAEPPPTAPPGSGADGERRLAQLRSQLSTLTNALATVTQEKSRMEAGFQADKRQLKQELEEQQARLAASREEQGAELQGLQRQLAECRARVITQQHERAQEQGDHAQQLRELQKILQQERDARQDAELRLQDANAALLLSSQAAGREAESEARLSRLREEREELRRRLRSWEEEQRRPDPRVEQLQQELAALQGHLQQQAQLEGRKARDAEERARERARAAEQRVSDLEQRVSELSELLGSSEKSRQREQQLAWRLRERLLQLDLENKSLALSAASRSQQEQREEQREEVPVPRQRGPEEQQQEQQEQQQEPQQELRQLREEFERYKQRAQLVLKNKSAKDGCQSRELEEARQQLAELKEKYVGLRVQSEQAQQQQRRRSQEQQQQALAQQQAQRQEAQRLQALHRQRLTLLEAELHKQRERTMALLDEKDQELGKLRAALAGAKEAAQGPPGRPQGEAEGEAEGEGDALGRALRQAAPNEPALLLYAEQLARKEAELAGLRRQKRRLEEDLRRLRAELLAGAERHQEEGGQLRGQLAKLLRDQSREGANMEYLKNVIYRFLTLPDAGGRQQTLAAILTILHFSPQEKQSVMKLQGAGWWTAKS